MKKILVLISLILLFSACTPTIPSKTSTTETEKQSPQIAGQWINTELTDAATGETFSINDFKGKPILLESFAVWCPICLKQQKEIQKVEEQKGDAIIHISLDTDPNEDADKVKQHKLSHGFEWFYSVAPIEMTQALIDDFGIGVVNAPSAPVILICEDQTTRLLPRGVKTASELVSEVDKGC